MMFLQFSKINIISHQYFLCQEVDTYHYVNHARNVLDEKERNKKSRS